MHKCINNSIGNIYHLEQFVSEFYPYSQKQLGFNQPATIRFESDEDNAGVMLGKTAYYDPEGFEIVLYTDGRHPKDVMRSLSHELVHHAQNCRGDFSSTGAMETGYAQSDPHLRKMEREAYTKGNLIFRDFEDLIKTGKINIEIDFSDSGEPKMSLKEWKNNEINTKLMKKWGLLKEEKNEPADIAKGDDELAGDEAGEKAAEELEEGHEHGPECGCPDMEEGFGWRKEDEDDLDEAFFGGGAKAREKLAGRPEFSASGPQEDDPGMDPPTAAGVEMARTKKAGNWGKKVRGGRAVPKAAGSDVSAKDRRAGSRSFGTMGETSGKISVREAKEITRRIIERIKKESK